VNDKEVTYGCAENESARSSRDFQTNGHRREQVGHTPGVDGLLLPQPPTGLCTILYPQKTASIPFGSSIYVYHTYGHQTCVSYSCVWHNMTPPHVRHESFVCVLYHLWLKRCAKRQYEKCPMIPGMSPMVSEMSPVVSEKPFGF